MSSRVWFEGDIINMPVEVWNLDQEQLLESYWHEAYADESWAELSRQVAADLTGEGVDVHRVVIHEGSIYVSGKRH